MGFSAETGHHVQRPPHHLSWCGHGWYPGSLAFVSEDSTANRRSHDTSGSAGTPRAVPPLPGKLASPAPVVLVGTLAWLVAFATLGILDWIAGHGVGVQFWTCLAGWVLGFLGYGVFRWQRSAARRGAPGAWKGLAGLDG